MSKAGLVFPGPLAGLGWAGQGGTANTGGSALACRSIATGGAGLNRINTTVTGTERAELWANSLSTLVRSFIHRNSSTDSQACNTPRAKIRTWMHRASCNIQPAQVFNALCCCVRQTNIFLQKVKTLTSKLSL